MFLESLDNQTRSAVFDPADRLLSANLDTATTTIPTIETNQNHHSNNIHLNTNNNNNHHQLAALQSLPCFNDLIAVLIECFSLIAIGYLSGRFKVISPEAKDLGAYLTTFALPMIIFLNVAQMEIQTINVSFLVCMLISKLLIFLLVSLVTLAISYPTNFSYAGALSILSTQSNDFALGYPLFKSLYGESKPEMLNYLNLMGPIQLLIINPLGIIMLELGKSQMKRRARRRLAKTSHATKTSQRPIRCSHCLATATAAAAATAASKSEGLTKETQADGDHGLIGRDNDSNNKQSTSGMPFGNRANNEQNPKRKNCKSLVLVMPARVVSEAGLSDDSVGSFKEQQVNVGKPLSPNLLGPVSPNDNRAAHQSPADNQPSRNWVSPLLSLIRFNRSDSAQGATGCTCHWSIVTEQEPDESIVDLSFFWALLTNPLIIVSLVALAVNLIHGPELPKFVTKVSNTIAASFAAPALLVVGLSMYGKFKLIRRNPNDLLLASVLVMTKVMVLPNIMRTVMQVTLPHYVDSQDIPHLVDFSYLYGLLPTAPGACIIAKQYEILTNVVSISMLLSTFISAPLMLGTSVVISKAATITPETIVYIMGRVLKVSSSVTITFTFLTLYLLWKSNGYSVRSISGAFRETTMLKSRHLFTIMLTIMQLIVGLGGFLWLLVDTTKIKPKYLQGLFQTLALNGDDYGDDNDGSAIHAISDLQLPGASDVASIHWAHVDADEDILGQDDRLHFLTSARAHTSMSSFGGFKSISSFACTISYIQASGGLLLAKFLILCIVVINFARHSRGHQVAMQVSSLMTKVFPLLALSVFMCSVFESNHITCQPTESSLPRWSFSLYARLIYNSVLLCLALVLFVATFRLKNKRAWPSMVDEDLEVDPPSTTSAIAASTSSLTKRQFTASNVSLSSGTSSEITTSTNLDTNALGQIASKSITMVQHVGGNSDAAAMATTETVVSNLLIDYGRVYEPKLEANPVQAANTRLVGVQTSDNNFELNNQNRNCHQNGYSEAMLNHGGQSFEQYPSSMHLRDVNNNGNGNGNCNHADRLITDSNEPTVITCDGINHAKLAKQHDIHPRQTRTETLETTNNPIDGEPCSFGSVEFDRNSILVVFMLFQAMLSVTSILQILFQDRHSSGTFIMVEIINVIVDLGQGLITFLVVGTQIFSIKFGSRSNGSTRPTGQVQV